MTKGSLFLIPTFLYSESDGSEISPQIKEVLLKTKIYFVENVRTARRYISALKLNIEIDSLIFHVLDKDSDFDEVSKLLVNYLTIQLKDVGIISESGCPGIADPGSMAAHIAHVHHVQVVPLAGPSSIFMALMASGFNGQSFVFHGYLPIDSAQRIKQIKKLEQEAKAKNQTQIFIETPFRNNQMLADIVAHAQPNTKLCVACQVSAPDQVILTKTIKQWTGFSIDLHKKPTVFLLL